jgi:predicted transcriptional regulator
MLICMRTTVRLDDTLMRDAKAFAARTGRTLTQLIEDSLRSALVQREPRSSDRPELPVVDGGRLRPGVDLDSMSDLLETMERDAAD